MYNQESKKIWEDYLQYLNDRFRYYTPLVYKNTNYNAVIVEPRLHENLSAVLKVCLYHLNENQSDKKWGLQILHGTENEEYVKECVLGWDNVVLTNIGVKNLTNIQHSELMETSNFWKQLNGQKILIFQTDSILLRNGIDEFLDFDYVGAPWRKPKENQYVGNGGLSLRSKNVMIEICEKYKETEQIWEDIYFVKHLKGKGVADVETAKRFSMEDVYSENPLGVHNPIRHIEPIKLKEVLYKKKNL